MAESGIRWTPLAAIHIDAGDTCKIRILWKQREYIKFPRKSYHEPDPECSLDYITTGVESIDLNSAMSNSFGFGRGNTCLMIRKFGG